MVVDRWKHFLLIHISLATCHHLDGEHFGSERRDPQAPSKSLMCIILSLVSWMWWSFWWRICFKNFGSCSWIWRGFGVTRQQFGDCAREESAVNIKADPPWFEFLATFDLLAPWYRRGREASSVKISYQNSKEKLVKWATEVARLHKVLYKVVHKIGRLRKFNRAREIELNFLPLGLCSWNLAHLFIMSMATKACLIFFNFCLGT